MRLSEQPIAQLLTRHRELHSMYYQASLPSAAADNRMEIWNEHAELVKELIRRDIYHPVLSALDRETVEEMDAETLREYFTVLNSKSTLPTPPQGLMETGQFVADMLVMKYAPHQPRDDFGRWIPYGQRGIGGSGDVEEFDDRAKVRVWDKDEERIRVIADDMFSRDLSANLVSNLMGHPIGGSVTIRSERSGLRLDVEHKNFREHKATIRKTDKGLEMQQKLTPRINLPDNTAAKVVKEQLDAVKQLRIKRLLADATRNAWRDHDYRNMARAGFDAPFPARLRAELAKSSFPDIKDVKNISDLMLLENGRKWWQTHGVGFIGEFDLRPNSVSMRLLNRFIDDESYIGG